MGLVLQNRVLGIVEVLMLCLNCQQVDGLFPHTGQTRGGGWCHRRQSQTSRWVTVLFLRVSAPFPHSPVGGGVSAPQLVCAPQRKPHLPHPWLPCSLLLMGEVGER